MLLINGRLLIHALLKTFVLETRKDITKRAGQNGLPMKSKFLGEKECQKYVFIVWTSLGADVRCEKCRHLYHFPSKNWPQNSEIKQGYQLDNVLGWKTMGWIFY